MEHSLKISLCLLVLFLSHIHLGRGTSYRLYLGFTCICVPGEEGDPYALVTLLDSNGTKTDLGRTEIKENRMSDWWGKVFSFNAEKEHRIRVELWDKDKGIFRGRDDKLGTVEFLISDASRGPVTKFPLPPNSELTSCPSTDSLDPTLKICSGKFKPRIDVLLRS